MDFIEFLKQGSQNPDCRVIFTGTQFKREKDTVIYFSRGTDDKIRDISGTVTGYSLKIGQNAQGTMVWFIYFNNEPTDYKIKVENGIVYLNNDGKKDIENFLKADKKRERKDMRVFTLILLLAPFLFSFLAMLVVLFFEII